MASEKRVVFRSSWLPWVLLAPQVAVILVFFFWPAAQALLQSFQQSDAFGISTEWVGLQNFENLLKDDTYLASFKTTAVFSVLVAGLGIAFNSTLVALGLSILVMFLLMAIHLFHLCNKILRLWLSARVSLSCPM